MAKFSRYDPRNKKKNRNKVNSQNREFKIKDQVKKVKYVKYENLQTSEDRQGV